MAQTFRRAAEFDTTSKRDALTGLPTLGKLHHILEGIRGESLSSPTLALLFIDLAGLAEINLRYGRTAGDDTLLHVTQCIQESLGVTDILFRDGGHKFIALLTVFESISAQGIARKIRDSVRSRPVQMTPQIATEIYVDVAVVDVPADVLSFPDLIASGRSRVSSQNSHGSRVH
jgi:diguanylate cyclase (GGDEF)-like protein